MPDPIGFERIIRERLIKLKEKNKILSHRTHTKH